MKNALAALLVFCSSGIFSQGIINNGAHIVFDGPAYIVMSTPAGNYLSQNGGIIDNIAVGGTMYIPNDWINNSANNGFSNDGTAVALYGGTQSIGGTTPTYFYSIYCISVGSKVLNINTTVGGQNLFNGQLVLGSSVHPFDLNGYRLDVTNPLPGAISYSSGYIISETNASLNPSVVRWNVGANAGSYIIPFGLAGTQIPFTFNITSPMAAGTDYVDVSTRATAATSNTPWANTVTHMFSPNLGQDGSDEAVIDRWWELTFSNAATSSLTFSYLGAENTMQVPYNTGNVGAQWWATGWFPNNANVGSAPAVTAGVGSVTATGIVFPANTYRPMVLSSLSAPLPIELISFKSNCVKDQQQITWSTASETNNDFFTVERSDDGVTFRDIGTVNGHGTTTQFHQYNFTDPQPVLSAAYYRLRQTDYNGQSTTSTIIVGEKCGSYSTNFIDAYSSGSAITILLDNTFESAYKAELYDAQGKLVISQNFDSGIGANRFTLNDKLPATGIYLLTVAGSHGETFSKKLFVAAE